MFDSMNVDIMTSEQVADSVKKIEDVFRRASGDVDLIKLSEEKNLYNIWRQLRDRQRRERKVKTSAHT